MYDLTPVEWILAAFAAIGIGMAKAGFGGLGMLAILVMARVLPARESTGAILPMLILADVFAVYTYRQHARGGLVLRMLPPAFAGIVCGWLLMPYIPAQGFGQLIGWLTLGADCSRARTEICAAIDEFCRRASRYRLALWLACRLDHDARQRGGPGHDHLSPRLPASQVRIRRHRGVVLFRRQPA